MTAVTSSMLHVQLPDFAIAAPQPIAAAMQTMADFGSAAASSMTAPFVSQPATDATAAAAPASPTTLMQATTSFLTAATNALLAPLAPNTATDNPMSWAMLAAARRQLGAAAVDPPSAAATTTPTTAALVQSSATAPANATPAAAAAASDPVISPVAGDNTAHLQAAFDSLQPGQTLTLAPGTYDHSGVLYIRQSNVTIDGGGATLYATNPSTAALVVQGNNVTVKNLNIAAPTGLTRADSSKASLLVLGGTGNHISDVTVTGGQSAGVYIPGASQFEMDNVTVSNTAADGVQMTYGTNNGVLNNVTTNNTGDDGIAVVSYVTDPGPVHDITINSPTVSGAAQRGLVVAGGQNITMNNINVSDTKLSGVWIGSQSSFYTQSVNGVQVTGGTVTRGNSGGLPLGAVAVVSQNPGQNVSNVTVSNLTITDTPASSYTNVGVYSEQGAGLSNIAFRNIAIWQMVPNMPLAFYAYGAPAGSYTATGFTMNGMPAVVL